MNWNEYLDDVRDSAQDFLGNNYQHAADFEQVFDVMMDEDSVTGVASGSFTFDRAKAEENIAGILDDANVYQMFLDIGWTDFPEEAEDIDVGVRCFALNALHDELEEYFNNR